MSLFFKSPTLINEEFAAYRGFTAKATGDGMLINQIRLQNGLQVSTVGGVDFRHFIGENLSVEDLEQLAWQVGEDAALGRAIRKTVGRVKNPVALGKVIIRHFKQKR